MKTLREKFSEWERKDPVLFAITLIGGCELLLCLAIAAATGR